MSSGQSQPGIARQEFTHGADIDLGSPYSIAGWLYVPSNDPLTGTREATLRMQWVDHNNTLLGDAVKVFADASSPLDEWLFVKFEDIAVPDLPNIAEVRASIFVNNVGPTSVNSGVVYFDDMTFNQGPFVVIEGIPGDVNQDGIVNLLDIEPFVQIHQLFDCGCTIVST